MGSQLAQSRNQLAGPVSVGIGLSRDVSGISLQDQSVIHYSKPETKKRFRAESYNQNLNKHASAIVSKNRAYGDYNLDPTEEYYNDDQSFKSLTYD